MMNFGNAPVLSQGTVPPPSAPGVSGVLPGQSAVNITRILQLTGFSKDLKTRDIQNIFVDFEDDRGGYRIKWLDDTGCLIVFSDPMTGMCTVFARVWQYTDADGTVRQPNEPSSIY